MIIPQKYYEEKSYLKPVTDYLTSATDIKDYNEESNLTSVTDYLTSATDIKDYEKISTCVIYKDNSSCHFGGMMTRNETSNLSSLEYPITLFHPISETYPSNEFNIYGGTSYMMTIRFLQSTSHYMICILQILTPCIINLTTPRVKYMINQVPMIYVIHLPNTLLKHFTKI